MIFSASQENRWFVTIVVGDYLDVIVNVLGVDSEILSAGEIGMYGEGLLIQVKQSVFGNGRVGVGH